MTEVNSPDTNRLVNSLNSYFQKLRVLNKVINDVLEINKKIRSKEAVINTLKTKTVIDSKGSNDRNYKLK